MRADDFFSPQVLAADIMINTDQKELSSSTHYSEF